MRCAVLSSALLLLAVGTASAEPVDFVRQVQPILRTNCVSCHGPTKQKAGLKLELGTQVLKGSLNGPVVVPKNAAASKLVHALKGERNVETMPPTGALPAADIAVIVRWIDEGASVPPDEKDPSPPHWAYQPPKQAPLPSGVHPVDHFLQVEWQKKGLTPAGAADKETLLRRITLDLTGLPPTPADIDAFLNDTSPDAYEKKVDALLATRQYGERWGRHFLDIWRYADWYGFGGELRNSQKHIWNWRDWTVESLNANKPYTHMIREMLAADEVAPTDDTALRATGFLARNYYKFNRNVWLDDVVEHTGKAFLGVTLNCCRCHDHMYDPLSQEEYYRFRAIFEPHQVRLDAVAGEPDVEKRGLPRVYDADAAAKTFLFVRGNDKTPGDKPLSPGVPAAFGPKGYAAKAVPLPPEVVHPTLRAGVRQAQIAQAAKQLDTFKTGPRHLVAVVQLQAVKAKLDADAARYAVPPKANAAELVRHAVALHLETMALAAEAEQAEAVEALRRLEAAAKKDATAVAAQQKRVAEANAKVETTRKAVATPPADYPPLVASFPPTSTVRRTALADWIASKENPLTARVLVNHVWLRHFGQPIVPTVFEFGKNGRPPSHPALLDWLAVDFMDSGWDLKKLHRRLLTSAAYRMASSLTGPTADANRTLDPDNLLLWRMNPRPLEAEAIRDTLLSVSGLLDSTLGGPELDFNDTAEKLRRTLYYRHAPEKVMPFTATFDGPSPTECYRRQASIVPQQALALINSRLSARAAAALSKGLKAADAAGKVTELYRLLLGRHPTDAEARLCTEFLATHTANDLALVLFNHTDFTTIR